MPLLPDMPKKYKFTQFCGPDLLLLDMSKSYKFTQFCGPDPVNQTAWVVPLLPDMSK